MPFVGAINVRSRDSGVGVLLDAGLDPNICVQGKTLLEHALCYQGSRDVAPYIAKVLINAGASLKTKTNKQKSYLHDVHEPGLLELLLQKGLSVNECDEN